MAEWSNAAVLKTVEARVSGGSNPSPSAKTCGKRHIQPQSELLMGIYLGFHAGYSQFSATLTDGAVVLAQAIVEYGKDLPQYCQPDGTLPGTTGAAGTAAREFDPRMWTDALKLTLQRLRDGDAPLDKVDAVTGTGQGGCMICLDAAGHFTRLLSPMQADTSCAGLCRETELEMGPDVIARTGGKISEDDMLIHIRSFAHEHPFHYARTARFHTVSSFLCSELIGSSAPIACDDASRTHLLDLGECHWNADACAMIAAGLYWKLPEPVPHSTVAGYLSPLYARYGLKSGIPVMVWTGETCELLYSLQATAPGTAALLLLPTVSMLMLPMDALRFDPFGQGRLLLGYERRPVAAAFQVHAPCKVSSTPERARILALRMNWTGLTPERVRLATRVPLAKDDYQKICDALRVPLEPVAPLSGGLSLSAALRACHVMEARTPAHSWASFWTLGGRFEPAVR